jgi:hypothetical protein
LNEVDERKLPIDRCFEAQSIAIALEKEIKPPRPLHMIYLKILQSVLILLLQSYHKLVDGVFYSNHLRKG